jgi:hypothetical protein
MNKGRFTLSILTSIIFIFALAAATQAQATRTWVSGVGDDVNPCSRTAPCKTYAGAISKTAKDGEISTLDPGGFGTLTITKSITVNGGGAGQGYGSVLSALAPQGFLINITDINDVRKTVRLNWLDINGASSGTDGVRFIAGSALHIENTNIDGLVGDGVDFNLNTATNAELYMKNVSIRNCVGNGIIIQAAVGGHVDAVIDSVMTNNGGDGIEVGNRAVATINNCVVSTNNQVGSVGIRANGTGADVTIHGCTISYNQTGVKVDAGAARISGSTLSNNSTGLNNAVGGTALKTFGTNRNDSPTATSGTITPISES